MQSLFCSDGFWLLLLLCVLESETTFNSIRVSSAMHGAVCQYCSKYQQYGIGAAQQVVTDHSQASIFLVKPLVIANRSVSHGFLYFPISFNCEMMRETSSGILVHDIQLLPVECILLCCL